MMDVISAVVVGLVVGLLARAILPGKQSMGLIMTILLGIAGSFAAKYAGIALNLYKAGEAAGWIMSIIGALILLVLYERVVKSKAPSTGA